MALRETLVKLGWQGLNFEPATFIKRNKHGTIIGIMCLHVDDFLVGIKHRTTLRAPRS